MEIIGKRLAWAVVDADASMQSELNVLSLLQISTVEQFWSKFDKALCDDCREKLGVVLDLPAQKVREIGRASSLLREAMELDPENQSARDNFKLLTDQPCT
jgi:hypothetical protein